MSELFANPIFIHLHGAHDRTVWMRSWAGDNTRAARAKIRCSLTDLSGSGVFNISTGYGETKGLTEWQLTKRSQDELIAWAATQKRDIEPSRRKVGQSRVKRKRKPDNKQTDMEWD